MRSAGLRPAHDQSASECAERPEARAPISGACSSSFRPASSPTARGPLRRSWDRAAAARSSIPLPTMSSTIFRPFRRARILLSDAITCQGAWSVSVRSSMSSYASMYCLALGDVAEILQPDLVVLMRVVEPRDHAPLLLLRADMDQELDDAHAVVGELALELVDLAIGPLPGVLAAKTLDALDQHAAVPGAVEDRPVARRRQAVPEAPQVMAALLLGRRRPDAPDMDRFRLQRADDALDQAALAGGVPAVEADQDPAAGAQIVDLQVEQPVLELFELVFVVVLVDRVVVHLDLVEARPLAHQVPPVADRASAGVRRQTAPMATGD